MNLLSPSVESAQRFITALAADRGCEKKKLSQKLIGILFDRWMRQQAGLDPAELIALVYDGQKRRGTQDQGNIHVLKNAANGMLRSFCAQHVADFGFHVQISRSPYQLQFVEPGTHDPATDDRDGFEIFWDDYIQARTAPLVVFTSPLFFRDNEFRYVRDININSESEKSRLDAVLGDGKSANLTPSRHYYSAGEVNGVLHLLSEFLSRGIHIDYRIIGSHEPLPELDKRNIVALGSGRTNWYLETRQADLAFVVNRSDVVYNGGEQPVVYQDHTNRLGRLEKYAVLTRRPGTHLGLSSTMIAANHGRASEGVAEYILREKELASLIRSIAPDGRLPDTFQVLFKVTVHPGLESVILDTQVAETWAPAAKSQFARQSPSSSV